MRESATGRGMPVKIREIVRGRDEVITTSCVCSSLSISLMQISPAGREACVMKMLQPAGYLRVEGSPASIRSSNKCSKDSPDSALSTASRALAMALACSWVRTSHAESRKTYSHAPTGWSPISMVTIMRSPPGAAQNANPNPIDRTRKECLYTYLVTGQCRRHSR